MDKELLESFCGGRFSAPFSDDQYTYATDGRHLVRVKKLEGYAGNGNMPNAAELFATGSNNYVSVVSMSDVEVDPGACPRCKGDKNAKPQECPECSGCGVVEFDNEYSDYEVECKTCDGLGKINMCGKCHGSGVDTSAETEIMGTYFMNCLLYNVKKLPGCQLRINADKTQPHFFNFDGGDGLIMCINK
jgi:hypothetical protein